MGLKLTKDNLSMQILRCIADNPGINISQLSSIVCPELSVTAKKNRLSLLEREGLIERIHGIRGNSWAFYITAGGEAVLGVLYHLR